MKCPTCGKPMIKLNTEISQRIYMEKWVCKACKRTELIIKKNDGTLMR
jgi:transposase-like protein